MKSIMLKCIFCGNENEVDDKDFVDTDAIMSAYCCGVATLIDNDLKIYGYRRVIGNTEIVWTAYNNQTIIKSEHIVKNLSPEAAMSPNILKRLNLLKAFL